MFNQHAKVILLNILLNSPFPRRPCQIMHPVYSRSPHPPSRKKKKKKASPLCSIFLWTNAIPRTNGEHLLWGGGGGVNEVIYGLCENGDSTHERETIR